MALSESEKQELAELRRLQKWEGAAETRQEEEPGFGEKAKALGYGAATGLVGGLGELETLGAYTIPRLVGFEAPAPEKGRATIFPTVEEARKGLEKVGIQRPREEVSGYETAGELIGGFGTAIPKAARKGAQAAFGVPSRTSEAYAKTAEKLGFKLSPAQVRQDVPIPQRGAVGFSESNQKLANELASKGTGKTAAEITPDFIRERLKTLGKEFDTLYKGKQFNIDLQAVQAIDALRQVETMLPGAAQVTAIKNTANSIIEGFGRMASRPGAKPSTFAIEGDALQTIRNDLAAAARSTSNRGDAHRIYELIDIIDGSVARNHPNIAAKLDVIRPQYRNSIVLEDLTRRNGIQQGNISLEKLGDMLGQSKGGVRRGASSELDQLGEMGRALKIRARWQPVGTGTTEELGGMQKLLGLGTDIGALATGARTRPARAAQRFYAGRPEPSPLTRAPEAVAAGTLARPVNPPMEEE